MKTSSKVGIAVIALMALGIQHASAHHNDVRGCPSGTAIQGVDFFTHKLVCVPVGGGSGALKVMDANNQEAGVFVGFGSLARLVNNDWTLLTFDQNGFNGGGGFALWYQSTDCSGPAYIGDFTSPVIPKPNGYTVNGTSVTIYSPVPNSFGPISVLSFWNVPSTGIFDPANCGSADGSQQTLGVLQTTTISNNPPFRISQ